MQILDQNAIFLGHHQCWINVNRGPWQLFSRGPLLTRDKKTYLNYTHASESTLDSGTSSTASHLSRHDMLAIISSRYQYGSFFVAEIMSNYLTTDGLKKISLGLLPEAPWGPWHLPHICRMVNPALGVMFMFPTTCDVQSDVHVPRMHNTDAAYCYRRSGVVCHSLCTSKPCKNSLTDRNAVWRADSHVAKEPCIRWGAHWYFEIL